MADLRDPKVVRASYLHQLLDLEGSDLKKVYEPVSHQFGYVMSFFTLLMVAHFAWKRYKKWRDEKKAKFIPYKVIKPPSSMVSHQQGTTGDNTKRVCAVVGGTGFIGSHVVNELVKRKEYYVFVLGRTFRSKRTNPDADCLIQVDLLDFDGLTNALQGVDSVINTAAVIPNVYTSADEIYSKNLVGIRNLLKAAQDAGVKSMIHLSGFHMAGKSKDSLISAFISSFYALEKDVVDANGEAGMQTSVVGPSNIIGRNSPFIDEFISGKMKSFPMNDNMPVSFMPVEYLATALVNAERKLTTPSSAKEIAGKILQLRGEPMSWKTFLALPGWSQKISNTSRFILYIIAKINVICATLFNRAPFGPDLIPGMIEFVDFVEEETKEEEVQEVYKVLEVGPPHPPMDEYVKHLVQTYKAEHDNKKEK